MGLVYAIVVSCIILGIVLILIRPKRKSDAVKPPIHRPNSTLGIYPLKELRMTAEEWEYHIKYQPTECNNIIEIPGRIYLYSLMRHKYTRNDLSSVESFQAILMALGYPQIGINRYERKGGGITFYINTTEGWVEMHICYTAWWGCSERQEDILVQEMMNFIKNYIDNFIEYQLKLIKH